MSQISFAEFAAVELRVGRVTGVEEFPKARKPAYKLKIFFGEEIGTRQSSAQITNYLTDELLGKQVICVMNFAPKKIAGFSSEVLVLGVDSAGGGVSVITPDSVVADGQRVY